jgi:hypothetical protein
MPFCGPLSRKTVRVAEMDMACVPKYILLSLVAIPKMQAKSVTVIVKLHILGSRLDDSCLYNVGAVVGVAESRFCRKMETLDKEKVRAPERESSIET